ncbi:paraquat-inducible protein A [Pseudomonas hefeiensis]|uniref:Paraquat-inducible protein A n=1 Tax=Pseudomonas hefeiensis TaxID=2738125 RepID=A0ABY9GIP4_9PSED|nr:paraquat-inducible protein A [Pseudomonas sp. FP205]WLH15464.1 paraquat-inducible protein A [Pseudomonas sp. FP205]
MPHFSNLIICEHCDTVYLKPHLSKSQTAKCLRCDAVLFRSSAFSIQQLLALTVTAALLFVAANIFPVMSIGLQGLSNQATLYDSVRALAQGEISAIAAVAGLTIILAPMLQIALLSWLLSFACADRAAPVFRVCMRMLEYLRPWSMLEVCLLGVLVAVIKLAGLLDVHPDLGLWSLAMLMVLLILISGKGIRRLWVDLEGKWND